MAYNLITDYEFRYKVVGSSFTGWTVLSEANAVDNGNGTITITGLNYDIAIGDFQVRVKAKDGNPPSTALTNAVAFTAGDVPITPAAPTMAVEDLEDYTIGFTLSSGYTLGQHEYRYKPTGGSFTSWATCATNPIQLPNADIAIGDVEIRVKAIGINNPSAVLENDEAFSETETSSPTIILDDVPVVGVGDDIYIGFTSNSAGEITITSSDVTKGTVLKTDNYLRLRGVAAGTFNIIINQAAAGEFDAGTLTTACTVAVVDKDMTAEYTSYSTGLAAVSNGQYFSLKSSDGLSKKVYLKDGGQGVYQRTVPIIAAPHIHTVNKAILEDVAGEMPTGVHSDIDSISALFHLNRLKSLDEEDAVTSNILNYPKIASLTAQGSVVITNIDRYGEKSKAFKVKLPANVAGAHAPFIYSGEQINCPQGKWSFQMDVKVEDGEPDMTLYYANEYSGTGVGYQAHTVTDEYTTIVFDSFHLTTEGDADPDGWYFLLASGLDGNTDEKEFYVTNIKLVAGSVKNNDVRSTKSLSMADGGAILTRAVDNMKYDFQKIKTYSSKYYSLASDLKDGSLAEEGTLIFAVKFDEAQSILYAFAKDGINFDLAEIVDGQANLTTWFSNVFIRSIVLNDYAYHIIATTNNGVNTSIYLNGYLIANKLTAGTLNNYFNGLEFFGIGSSEYYSFKGEMSGLSMWLRGLSSEEVFTASEIIRKRLLYKGINIPKAEVFLLTEGDSITWMPNSYQYLLRQSYTPSMNGSSPSESGAKLGVPGDELPTNTLFARKEWVLAMAQEQVDLGKNVIMTINIGSNDLFSVLLSSPAVVTWYGHLCDYIEAFTDIGVKVCLCTIMDVVAITDKTYLTQINGLITGDTSRYTALIDFHANPHLGDASDTDYFYDGQHPTALGFETMKDVAKPIIDGLL